MHMYNTSATKLTLTYNALVLHVTLLLLLIQQNLLAVVPTKLDDCTPGGWGSLTLDSSPSMRGTSIINQRVGENCQA